MNENLDRQIRELFEELDAAAPTPPATPQMPGKAPAPRWQKVVVPVGAAGALLLVVGVATQLLSGGAADEATGTTGGATATTATEAADATTAPDQTVETRPPDFALVLADLNLACTVFIEESARAIPAAPTTDAEVRSALDGLATPLEDLDDSIQEANAELEDAVFAPIPAESADLADSVSAAASGPEAEAPRAYQQAKTQIEGLADDLSAYGALECADLGGGIP